MSASYQDHRYSRQSFIGDQSLIENVWVGIAGFGGGGSVVLTQLAHIGFAKFIGYDPNIKVEEKHLNRTLGLKIEDVERGISKVDNAERIVRGLQPLAETKFIKDRWQNNPELLKQCHIIFGCVDGLAEREQLEAFCRRHGIIYIDIGLGVKIIGAEAPRLAGQIILSRPGFPCMRCMGFLNEVDLSIEAAEYGDAGGRPQVIWGNFILAATAVSMAVKLLTGWTGHGDQKFYLQYDGNEDSLKPHPKLKHLDFSTPCSHFPISEVGEPKFQDI